MKTEEKDKSELTDLRQRAEEYFLNQCLKLIT